MAAAVRWELVGGEGVAGSWTARRGQTWSRDESPCSMAAVDGDLLVGCKGEPGTAHLWRCRR